MPSNYPSHHSSPSRRNTGRSNYNHHRGQNRSLSAIITLLKKGKFDKFDELTANHKSKILSTFKR